MTGRESSLQWVRQNATYPIKRLSNSTNEIISPVFDHTVSPFARITSHHSIDPERTAASCDRRAIGCVSRPKLGRGSSKDCGKSAYMLHFASGHSIFAVTDPRTYEYIPTNKDAIKKQQSANHDANFAFIVKTTDAVEIVKWYVMCALENECMAPAGASLFCNFQEDRFNHYANCHR
ncbi:hypothetical protein Y032_0193g1394 [Ancylostoma ceylanicum]|uniref:Uncharacterized protein n=1 Tax=Ancylostoma ceylanicum TaxID=53326 RepID=A0A016SP69_9BILA|nr:hypothetical protein Y032_0193g1394 [Ancylostoma ceylanicum]